MYALTSLAMLTCTNNGKWSRQPLNALPLQCVKARCNDTSDVQHKAIQSYPLLVFGDVRDVTYNTSFFHLQNGSLKVTCLPNRKMSWVLQPSFGNTCMVFQHKLALNENLNLYKSITLV